MPQPFEVWDADTELPPAAAAALIDAPFPEPAPARLEPLGEGWDDWDDRAYRVNRRWVFRFPRRAPAAPWLEAECRRARARFGALGYGVLLLDHGLRIEDAALVETARLALDQALRRPPAPAGRAGPAARARDMVARAS